MIRCSFSVKYLMTNFGILIWPSFFYSTHNNMIAHYRFRAYLLMIQRLPTRFRNIASTFQFIHGGVFLVTLIEVFNIRKENVELENNKVKHFHTMVEAFFHKTPRYLRFCRLHLISISRKKRGFGFEQVSNKIVTRFFWYIFASVFGVTRWEFFYWTESLKVVSVTLFAPKYLSISAAALKKSEIFG